MKYEENFVIGVTNKDNADPGNSEYKGISISASTNNIKVRGIMQAANGSSNAIYANFA